MEGENQPFTMAAHRRADGLAIVGEGASGITEEIDIVSAARYSHVEYIVHVLAIGGQVLGTEADHTHLQAGPAQDPGSHTHLCSSLYERRPSGRVSGR